MDLLSEGTPQTVNVLSGEAEMVSDGDDPQIIIKPRTRIHAGWYRFEADIVADAAITSQVYFDFGQGFSESLSTRLQPQGRGDRFALTLKLPQPALSVRLDPLNERGRFSVRRFTAERLSTAGLIRELAVYAAAVFRESPRDFVRRLPLYLASLRKPLFLQLHKRDARGFRRLGSNYLKWIERCDFDMARDGEGVRAAVSQLRNAPLISIVMPTYNTPERLLREAVDSVRGQIYRNWQLCIADDCSTRPHVRRMLEAYAAADPRIRVTFRRSNGHISRASNSALELVEGDWVAMLDHDDLLRPHALAEVALEIDRHPDAQIIYSDEDKLDRRGRRCEPYCKPDFSRELFRSQNYLNHLTVHRTGNIRAVGGWRPGFEGSQDYDLNLRVVERVHPSTIRHIPKILYHWRAVAGSTASAAGEKSYAHIAGLRALEEHVARTGLRASVGSVPGTPFYRLRLTLPEPPPQVSLIIPTRDRADLLARCVRSIRQRTDYAPYEIIIVDNGSVEPETHTLLAELAGEPGIRVLRYDKPFNYSAINNFAVDHAQGTVIGLINNDIETISPGWLEEMVSWAVQPDIGCVGAKLYYANGTVQHAGVFLGVGGVANHVHIGLPRHSAGHFGRNLLTANFMAVTGACLLLRRGVYEELGGLDAENLPVTFNDVDLCLRAREAGYQNVWTPFAELYHLESVSRGRDDSPEKLARLQREIDFMHLRWKKEIAADPYYSPNLTLNATDFSFRTSR